MLDEDDRRFRRWTVRTTISVPEDVDVLVVNGLIPIRDRPVAAIFGLGFDRLRGGEQRYIEHMQNW